MKFWDDKCIYQQKQNEKLLQCTKNLQRNQLSIKPIKDGDTDKHLGIDESISSILPIKKQRFTKKNHHRIK